MSNAIIWFGLLGQFLTTGAIVCAMLQDDKTNRVLLCAVGILFQTVATLCLAFAFLKV